jgi:hypothetical protein
MNPIPTAPGLVAKGELSETAIKPEGSVVVAPEELPPSTRADRLLRRCDDGWHLLDRLVHRYIPPSLNPLGQLGAMANTCLMIAVISGIALLFWYTPSVHQAHESLERLRASSWLGQLCTVTARMDACFLSCCTPAASFASGGLPVHAGLRGRRG